MATYQTDFPWTLTVHIQRNNHWKIHNSMLIHNSLQPSFKYLHRYIVCLPGQHFNPTLLLRFCKLVYFVFLYPAFYPLITSFVLIQNDTHIFIYKAKHPTKTSQFFNLLMCIVFCLVPCCWTQHIVNIQNGKQNLKSKKRLVLKSDWCISTSSPSLETESAPDYSRWGFWKLDHHVKICFSRSMHTGKKLTEHWRMNVSPPYSLSQLFHFTPRRVFILQSTAEQMLL